MTNRLIVSTEWLYEHLADADLRIVDIRGHVLPASEPPPHYFNHYQAYLTAHIPHATFIDWVHEITDPNDPRHAQIASAERFAAAMSRHGIGAQTYVIAYDDAGGMFAARLWWALNYYGHERVSVLDGGWQKWVAEGKPTTAEIPQIAPAQFTPQPNLTIYRQKAQIASQPAHHRALIDVRTPDEFHGKASRAARKGHIPGAVNLPRSALVTAEGTVPDAGTLREQFRKAGAGENEQEVIFYCNGGVSASYGLLAYRAAGFQGGAVYDGSWKDWGNDDTLPIE